MSQRIRKLIGTVALVVLLIVYALLVMALSATRVTDSGALTQLAFYAVAGLGWVIPAGAIIWWMQKP